MEDCLIEAADQDRLYQWIGLDLHSFPEAIANANSPAFPSFKSEEELDAATDAAWGELQRQLVEAVEDLCYSVGFKTEGEDLETLVLEANQGETIRSICERLWEYREFTPEGA
jgi:hypothetical protein